MNEKFGPILLDNTKEGDYFQQKYYSDVTGKEVDEEILKIVRTLYKETLDTITKYYDRLDAVAKALLEKEHLNREEFEAIMKGEDILSEKVEEIVEEKTTEDTLQNQ